MLLVTRPRQQAEATLARLEAMGFDAISAPMLTIVHQAKDPMPQGPFDGLLVTSINALPELGRLYDGNRSILPCFAVGPQVAAGLQRIGFPSPIATGSTARDLATSIINYVEASATSTLLNPTTRIAAFDFAAALKPHNITVLPWYVYDSIPATRWPDQVERALQEGTIDGVLLYSPRSAATFAALITRFNLPVPERLFCLSANIRDALPEAFQACALVAEQPDEGAMMTLVANHAKARG